MLRQESPPFEGHAAASRGPWVMSMVWGRLVFMHWAVPPEVVRRALPEVLQPHLDTFDGQAYLGVVPFEMSGLRGRGVPPVPGASAFPELNLRTYINVNDQPGVWFFSLDAAHKLAVRVARVTFGLPYFDAQMSVSTDARRVHYQSKRTHRGAVPGLFKGDYQPVGEVFHAEAGSLEEWLVERYCLYALRRGRLMRGDILHPRWPLQRAECAIESCDLGTLAGVELEGEPDSVLYADRLEVKAWLPVPVPVPVLAPVSTPVI